MILSSLVRYYDLLVERGVTEVPAIGYSAKVVAYALNLSKDGQLLEVIALGDGSDKRRSGISLIVPEEVKRTVNVAANFMWDNSKYVLGIDEGGISERSRQTFAASRELHRKVLGGVDDEGARAVLSFFDSWDPSQANSHPALKPVLDGIVKGGNIVFRLDGSPGYIHERSSVKQAWREYKRQTSSETTAQCLVTGQVGPIARLHPNIRGVRGTQSGGASLVSFNLSAFTSYGKDQGENAPVGEDAAFAYGTALNYMLSSSRQRLQLDSGTALVFWAESRSGIEENLMAEALHPTWKPQGDTSDSSNSEADTVRLVRDVLLRVRNGQPIDSEAISGALETPFFILGLSANAARLSVRFWHTGSFGDMLTRVGQHYADISIVRSGSNDPEFIPISWILNETAPKKARERTPPPLLAGGLMRSVLSGLPYPRVLYTALLTRIRSDQVVNYVRAAAIKGYLVRTIGKNMNCEEVGVTVSLNQESRSVPYRLGRLFAVLEKAQLDANPGINTTIRDRYFGSASATPRAVFPRLLRLSQHHISKSDYGALTDRRIQEIMDGLTEFPAHLDMDEQGMFMLGYYHQKQAFYEKSDRKEG